LLVLPDVRYQRPFEILDLRIELRQQPCGADRACVPGDGGCLLGVIEPFGVGLTDIVPRLPNASLRSFGIADFKASISAAASPRRRPAIETSMLWKRWKS